MLPLRNQNFGSYIIPSEFGIILFDIVIDTESEFILLP